MEILKPGKTWDVCVVGSGAGGGMAAKVLTEAGVEVVLLEAGPAWDVETDGHMFTWNHESPRRGKAHRRRPFGEFDVAEWTGCPPEVLGRIGLAKDRRREP